MSQPGDATWRPLGFFLLMIGFGLRLDTAWQGLGAVLVALGAASGGAGLWMLSRRRTASASVPPDGKG